MRIVLLSFLMLFVCSAKAQVSSGTAFSVAPQLLITNQHVVADCSTIEVVAPDGRRAASLVNSDAELDLALLRVSGLKGATVSLRSPRTIRLGETVMVFGFPLSGSLSSGGNFTSGIVSALRGLRNAAGQVQISAPVQPGNSGGPLLDASGNVIGVVSSKLDALRSAIASGDIPQNVNFAISLDVLADFLSDNKVLFRKSSRVAALDSARVAELAQEFTYRVECRGKSIQAKAPPKEQPRQPRTCPESEDNKSWNNCTGELNWPDGRKYSGDIKNGKPNGQGTATFADGWKYVGEYKNGKAHGKGTMTLAKKQEYFGDFENGMYNGQGTTTFANGEKYIGGFGNGEYNGQGALTFVNGNKYIGEFKDGKRSGQGTLTAANGDKYVGNYKDDQMSGHGTHTFTDGESYIGDFKDNKYDGKGKLKRANGAEYSGDFRDDKFNGQGTLKLPDGSEYIGNFNDGNAYGKGTLTFADGGRYVGNFKDNNFHGFGIFVPASKGANAPVKGETYSGDFKNDNRNNGYRSLTSPRSAVIQSGIWENGKFIGAK